MAGDELYRYGGEAYPPRRDTGPAPECRIEVSPSAPAAVDYFLHVLTAADSDTDSVPQATLDRRGDYVVVSVGAAQVVFTTGAVGGMIKPGDRQAKLSE